MKINRRSRRWEMLLGAVELTTVAVYAWESMRRTTKLAMKRDVLETPVPQAAPERVPAPVAPGQEAARAEHPERAEQHRAKLAEGPIDAVKSLARGRHLDVRELGNIAVEAAKAWSVHRAASKGAALALYTLFSLAPMLLLVIAVAGLFFGADAVRELILKQMSGVLGTQGAEAIKSILAGAHFESESKTAAIISAGLLLVGATSAFAELKDSLDELWEVPKSEGGGLWSLVRERFLSFGLVLVLALMLLISLAVSALLGALGDMWIGGATSAFFVMFAKVVSTIASFLIVTAMFAAIYKYLPAVPIAWHDVLLGALITSILFLAGKLLIGWYLGTTDFASGYGAAGSLVLLVSWIYYSAQIFFYGALFTHEHAVRSGRAKPTPKPAEAAPA